MAMFCPVIFYYDFRASLGGHDPCLCMAVKAHTVARGNALGTLTFQATVRLCVFLYLVKRVHFSVQ